MVTVKVKFEWHRVAKRGDIKRLQGRILRFIACVTQNNTQCHKDYRSSSNGYIKKTDGPVFNPTISKPPNRITTTSPK
uniref:Ovule protein n=1 Tax=Panagrellus redivivus TaxID=6233 RepID=A0A7E4V2G4_PANRE